MCVRNIASYHLVPIFLLSLSPPITPVGTGCCFSSHTMGECDPREIPGSTRKVLEEGALRTEEAREISNSKGTLVLRTYTKGFVTSVSEI